MIQEWEGYLEWLSDERAPRLLTHNGQQWTRFMDRLFIPGSTFDLSPSQVQRICEARLAGRGAFDASFHRDVQTLLGRELARIANLQGAVLDFGAGDGRGYCGLVKLGFKKIVQVDASLGALLANGNGERVCVASGGPLPFASGTFAAVRALFVMHFDIPLEMRKELARVLRDDGCLVANVYGPHVQRHRSAMSRAGFQLSSSWAVPERRGHAAETWVRAADNL